MSLVHSSYVVNAVPWLPGNSVFTTAQATWQRAHCVRSRTIRGISQASPGEYIALIAGNQ